MTKGIQFGNKIQCPHCKGNVQVRELSMREIRDELLKSAGREPLPWSSGDPTVLNKEEMLLIYNHVMTIKAQLREAEAAVDLAVKAGQALKES